MKILLTDKDKKYGSIIGIAILVIGYIYNRMYVKITDIAFVNDEPFELQIKCGYIFSENINILFSNTSIVKAKKYNHYFQLKGKDLYKNGKKVLTIKKDSEYQRSKTNPFVKI